MIAHALNIEQGGSRAEEFVYGWCPCSWTAEESPGEFAKDRIKRAFLQHLKTERAEGT